MPLADAIVTFEKDLAEGVRVHIEGVPAKISHTGLGVPNSGLNGERRYDRKTAAHLEALLKYARTRMQQGERDIRLRFEQEVQPPDVFKIEFSAKWSEAEPLQASRKAFDRVSCALGAMSIHALPVRVGLTLEAFAIAFAFDKDANSETQIRLRRLQDALVHLSSEHMPRLIDEATLTTLYYLTPHKRADYNCVRMSLFSQKSVELTAHSRALVVRSLLDMRRQSSTSTTTEILKGTLIAILPDNALIVKTNASRAVRMRHQPALGFEIRDYLGTNVLLTCIFSKQHGRSSFREVIDLEPDQLTS